MKHDPRHILVSVIRPTRVLGLIPHFFGITLIAPLVGGILAYGFEQPFLFWAIFLFVSSYGMSLYITFLDDDFIRVKSLQHKFKKTKNHRPEGVHKYVS